MTTENPREGGSYVIAKDGKRVLTERTRPEGGPDAPETPGTDTPPAKSKR